MRYLNSTVCVAKMQKKIAKMQKKFAKMQSFLLTQNNENGKLKKIAKMRQGKGGINKDGKHQKIARTRSRKWD